MTGILPEFVGTAKPELLWDKLIQLINMPKFYSLYDQFLLSEESRGKVFLHIGAPGPHILRGVADIIKEATIKHFDDSNPRNEEILQYGCVAGNQDMVDELTKFLNESYRNPVKREDIFIHSSASQAMANLLYHYFQHGQTIFIEDPSYHNVINDLNSENSTFAMKPIGIKVDNDGMNVDDIERHLQKLKLSEISERFPYRGAVYIIPIHQNPTGTVLTEERSKKLVNLARKYDLLVIADEVYNVMTYTAPDCDDPSSAKPPARLFFYDHKKDPDYKGNVVSVGSLSKMVAPGLRLGWYEMPEKMMEVFRTYFITDSGSAWNAFVSGIVAHAFKLGLLQNHIKTIRKHYWKMITNAHDIVTTRLGKYDVTCGRPTGGVFLWISLPTQFTADDLLKFCGDKISFTTGNKCSISNSFQNCLRLSMAFYDEDILLPAVSKLCDCIEEFIRRQE